MKCVALLDSFAIKKKKQVLNLTNKDRYYMKTVGETGYTCMNGLNYLYA